MALNRYNDIVSEKKNGMSYTRLPNTGLIVSRICLGCMSFGIASENREKWREWILSEDESLPFIQRALELGINFFDTAEIYSDGGSESLLGKALKMVLDNGSTSTKFRREDIVIATKVHPSRTMNMRAPFGHVQKSLGRKSIFDAVEGSLRRLQTDYIDLYQIHRWDYNTPIEETMEALHDLIKSGKVRYIGASSMSAWQFAKAQYVAEKHGWTKFISMQNHYNAIYREEEREMNPLCLDMGVGLIPWPPLARGYLTRRKEENCTKRTESDTFQKQLYYHDMDDKVVQNVFSVAAKHGVSAAEIALAWLLQKPGVCAPIVGATKIYHIEEAVEALQVNLTEEDIKLIERDYQPHPVLGHHCHYAPDLRFVALTWEDNGLM